MYRTDKSFMRDPSTVNCRIYVGNLDDAVQNEKLEEHFKKHGNILGIVVQRGFGFIQFEQESSAQEAIKNEHGVVFLGKKLNVKQAIDNKNKNQPPQQQQQQLQPQQQQQQQPQQSLNPIQNNENPVSSKLKPSKIIFELFRKDAY